MRILPIVFLLISGGTDKPSNLAIPSADNLAPVTGRGRLAWAVKSTIGPPSLLADALAAGWRQAFNRPPEFGRGIDGYGKRYGMRLSTIGTSNLMEAGLGAIWDEDPRYHRSPEKSTKGRLRHALKMTVLAERSDGSSRPAYARYIAYAGSNAISDIWRPDSQQTAGNTLERVGFRFGGRLFGNLWVEFWPGVKQRLFWNKH